MKYTYSLSIKLLFISICLFLFNASFSSEAPAILREWAAYAGISDSTFRTPVLAEEGYSYVATTEESTTSGVNISIIKYNSTGDSEWRQSWTGSGSGRDQPSDMVMDDNYLYVCGATYSGFSNFDYVIMKIQKSDGQIGWVQTFNGSLNSYDIATSIAVHDSAVYVTGVTSSINTMQDYYTLKLSKEGSILWGLNFDYNNLMEIPFAISYSEEDTAIIVTGASQSTIYDWDYQTNIYKYNGTIIHSSRETGTNVGFDRAQAVKTDATGNIYITGAIMGSNNNYDIMTIKLDKHGNILWHQTFDFNIDDIGNDLIVNDHGVYICGTTKGTGVDYLVMKLSLDDGHLVWDTSYNFDGDDTARAMCFDTRGNIVITGQAYNKDNNTYDFTTIALDERNGNRLWQDQYNGIDNGNDNATNISSYSNGDIFVTGQVCESECKTVTIKYKTDFFTHPPAVDTPSVVYLFYRNSGQLADTDDSLITDSVHYYTLHHYPQLYFGLGVMNMVWSHVDGDTSTTDSLQRVDVTFANSSNQTEAYPVDENDSAGFLNYYLAQCPNGITNIYGNGSLLFTDVYDGIDAIYSSNNAGLKLLFVISPGHGIPQEMGLAFEGDNGISIENNWWLNIHTSLGDYEFERPHVYQIDSNGIRKSLPWHLSWNIPQSGVANFTGWDDYNTDEVLIVEISQPATSSTSSINDWSTYFGGSQDEIILDVATDYLSKIYVTGTTSGSSNFPVSTGIDPSYNGSTDIIIMKFDNYAAPEWATYFGGSNQDYGTSLVVDSLTSMLCVTGYTLSNDFPHRPLVNPNNGSHFDTTYSGGYDGIIIKLSINGTPTNLWSQYIGGCKDDVPLSIDVDNSGSIFICGWLATHPTSCSSDLYPLENPGGNAYYQFNQNTTTSHYDSFISKLDSSNTIVWSTYLLAKVSALKVDKNTNELFVGGAAALGLYKISNGPCLATNNDTFCFCDPGNNAYMQIAPSSQSQGLIMKFSNIGELKWSTLFGGVGQDYITDIAINKNSDLYIVGVTNTHDSTDTNCAPPTNNGFPLCDPWQSAPGGGYSGSGNDNFIARFNSNSQITWSTFYGGRDNETSVSLSLGKETPVITTDKFNDVFIAGATRNFLYNEFPTKSFSGLYYDSLCQETDIYLLWFDESNQLQWATLFGDTGTESPYGIVTTNSNRLCFVGKNVWGDYPTMCPAQVSLPPYCVPPTDLTVGVITRFDLNGVVSVPELSNEKFKLKTFPNPTSDKTTIIINPPKINKETILDIYNSMGEIEFHRRIRPNSNKFEYTCDLSLMSAGIYFVHVYNNEYNTGTTIIKTK